MDSICIKRYALNLFVTCWHLYVNFETISKGDGWVCVSTSVAGSSYVVRFHVRKRNLVRRSGESSVPNEQSRW